ncbi:Fis family transcriptional regulator [Rhodopila sp.]|uniref:Fis family transcriptional regulator n=1 Tax=Rhodopila sp. TaxID=2480087 RepID=UPI002C178E8A|nr:Fis family transcriptional regulator [Rhodopila sp.]HVZ09948.1 Fis family transcriptional regulator [Rhodopila sp.]
MRAAAVVHKVACQRTQEMRRLGLTKAAPATRMGTSRAQVDRIPKAKGNVTIGMPQRAAPVVGRRPRVDLA